MIYLYTDGAAEPNPGPSAWGYTVVADNLNDIIHEDCGVWRLSTNQRAELMAIVKGLEWLAENYRTPQHVTVRSDSLYSINCLSKWWKTWARQNWSRKPRRHIPVKNQDIIKRGVELQKMHRIAFEWVKGHAGERWNEHVDSIVTAAACGWAINGPEDDGYAASTEQIELLNQRDEQEYQGARLQSLLWD